MPRDYGRVDKGKIISYRTKEGPILRTFKTLYEEFVPTQPKARFTPITVKPIIQIYTDELKEMREEFLKRKGLKNTMKEKGLERKLEVAVAFGSIIVSMLYFSTNATGLSIQNLNQTDINIVGAIFFVCGILGVLIWFRKR